MIKRIPFFYGWIIVGCAMCANFARQGSAVATLSIFVIPMSSEFGWTMTEFSAAVSLGGLLGAIISPKIGSIVDKKGPGYVLALGTVVIGVSMMALSQTNSLIWFYISFCLGRMAFAGPFEIAVTSAIVNWFIEKRGRALSFATLAHSIGLTVLPILAFAVIDMWNWRVGWFTIGAIALLVGVIPNVFFMIRRPEDIGLRPYTQIQTFAKSEKNTRELRAVKEHSFTHNQAYRTPIFWILMAFSTFIYPVQAGVSLHQAPLLIARGITPEIAAFAVGSFSLMAAVAGIAFGQLETRFGVYRSLAVAALFMTMGSALMLFISTTWTAFLSAIIFGAGIGGLLTLLPVAWANSFGREHLGSIRGITMPVQILAQASGPMISGTLFDETGTYDASLVLYCYFGIISSILALVAIKYRNADP